MPKIKSFVDRYGIAGVIRLAIDIMATKMVFANARVMRRPFYIRGRRHIRMGDGFTSGVGLRLDAYPLLDTFPAGEKTCVEIGRDVQVNDYVHINAIDSIKIGNNVLIASKVYIGDSNHGSYGFNCMHDNPDIPPLKRRLSCAPVVIGDNVWIGDSVAILQGVTIGQGAIIGAMSVVTKDIPPFCIAAGSPARIIKIYNSNTKKWERV